MSDALWLHRVSLVLYLAVVAHTECRSPKPVGVAETQIINGSCDSSGATLLSTSEPHKPLFLLLHGSCGGNF